MTQQSNTIYTATGNQSVATPVINAANQQNFTAAELWRIDKLKRSFAPRRRY